MLPGVHWTAFQEFGIAVYAAPVSRLNLVHSPHSSGSEFTVTPFISNVPTSSFSVHHPLHTRHLLLSSLVPVLVSLLLFSFFPQGRGFCSIMIYWFLPVPAGFRCLSPFFSLLSFLRKRVVFHHGFPGSSLFWGGFRCLSPFSFFSHEVRQE